MKTITPFKSITAVCFALAMALSFASCQKVTDNGRQHLNDEHTLGANKLTTGYDLSTYTLKLTVNGSNEPVLQVVTRSGESVVDYLNLSSLGAKIYTEDTDFYTVGSSTDDEQFVNTVDPDNNDMYLTTGAELEGINGSTIYLDIYNAYLQYEEGMVNFYEEEKSTIE